MRTVGHGDPRDASDAERWLPRLVSLAENSLLLPVPARPEEPADLGTLAQAAGQRDPADPALRGHDQRVRIFRLEREHDNVRAALRWLLDWTAPGKSSTAAEREAALRLAGALGYFSYVRGYHAEGRRWLDEARARGPEATDSGARIGALVAAGPLLMLQADYTRSQAVLTEALALAERQQDTLAIAQASTYLGHATVVAGDLANGTRRLEKAVQRWEVLGDFHGRGVALSVRP